MINLYNEDCLEAMKRMEDNSYDLAIVDPPYGINMDSDILSDFNQTSCEAWKTRKRKEYKKKDWDNQTPSKEYFDQLFRVSKHQIIFGCNYFTDKLPNHGGRIYWDKMVVMPTLGKGELAFCSKINSINQVSLLWAGYRKCEEVNRIHPTQKPVALYTWILSNYAKEGDKILDTHLGSGSIAIACHNLGYDLDGYELDVDYYEAATKRLKEHQRQLKLF